MKLEPIKSLFVQRSALKFIWLTGNKENQDAWTRIISYLIVGRLDSSGPQEIRLAWR